MSTYYSELSVPHRYNGYIQKFWTLDNLAHAFYTPVKYALPNGYCTLVFIDGKGVCLKIDDKPIELPAGIYIAGQMTKRIGISLSPHTRAVMAQVKPWLPALITNFPMKDLVNNVISLAYLNTKLYRKLLNVNQAEQKIVAAELCQKLESYLQQNADSSLIQWAFNRLENSQAQQHRIADLALPSGYTQRRIEQKFKALVGPTAKEIQRILQFRKVMEEFDQFQSRGYLSVLAHRHGYYDQSHFIRSYQRIMGETPSLFDHNGYILPISGHFDFIQSSPFTDL
ncbi:DUF6597 domain-containing transcriptional factor [Pedobacter sp. UBA5917]|jgi:methylphosphotriester-DNA--protein-cysteine methyltransferase|uniref:DUF6597 domain-containing transcriptional factor n=1 Tax=Pedobacter sp. UBA5917 TaxID=1947061 RepID=UPI0025E03AD9|nr:helix-turn-helix domain-containing protein [Pedobacter sp. UBA5917]